MKKKVLNIQLGTFWDADKKKNVAVTLPAYEKISKAGNKYYQANINIFVAEIEIKENTDDESV